MKCSMLAGRVILAIVFAAAPASAAVIHTWTAGASGNWSAGSLWTNGVPNAQGDVAQQTATGGPATTLDMNAVVGQIKNTPGSGTLWTIQSDGTHALTMDNAGGDVNQFGTTNASIGYTSSGPLAVRPSIVLRNTHLDVGTTGAVVNVAPGLVIGDLGSSTITAATPQLLSIRMNSTTISGGAARLTINSDVGGAGTSMAIWNVSTGTGAATLAGRVLDRVVELKQDSATTPLTLGGNNTYAGNTFITAGTLTAAADHALGASDVTVSASGQLTLTGGVANDYLDDDDATLSLTTGSAVNLNYTGTDLLASLRLNDVALPPGTYGSPTSGAANPLPIFTGTGTLTVGSSPLSPVPEPAAALALLPAVAATLLRRRRRHGVTSA